jgi:hypothetical protein
MIFPIVKPIDLGYNGAVWKIAFILSNREATDDRRRVVREGQR